MKMDRFDYTLRHSWKPGLCWGILMGFSQWFDLIPPEIVHGPFDPDHWLLHILVGVFFLGPFVTATTFKSLKEAEQGR